MDLKTEEVMNSNIIANNIMRDIIDIDRMEQSFNCELSSEELFRIDSAILASLRSTQDFSKDLLMQLEQGKFETMTIKPHIQPERQVDRTLEDIQKQTILDITLPLQNMFDEMSDYVAEALI